MYINIYIYPWRRTEDQSHASSGAKGGFNVRVQSSGFIFKFMFRIMFGALVSSCNCEVLKTSFGSGASGRAVFP